MNTSHGYQAKHTAKCRLIMNKIRTIQWCGPCSSSTARNLQRRYVTEGSEREELPKGRRETPSFEFYAYFKTPAIVHKKVKGNLQGVWGSYSLMVDTLGLRIFQI